jgi:SNF2 family DNA or RNA helicase
MKLFKHQEVSITFLGKHARVFDMSDPGTGKTAVHIVAYAKRRQKKRGKKCLVLAPKSLLHSAWEQDFRRFAPTLKVSVAYASNRKAALAIEADVYVANHDAVKDLVKLPGHFWKQFDTIIIDESTAFKHYTSARSKALGVLVQYFDHRELLSATPTSNGICDMWHQVKLLDDGVRLGKSYFSFRAAVCKPTAVAARGRTITTWEDKPESEAIVSALISDIVIRHRFEDCVDIPENHQYSVPFQLSPNHRVIYEQMKDECLIEFADGNYAAAVNAAVLYSKLLQVSSGAVYHGNDGYEVLDSDRYNLVMDLAEQRDHTVVFFNWQHQKDMLVREAESRNMSYGIYDGGTPDVLRARLVDQFQAGVLRVLFAHPQSAGHGLTLTKGAATIWASPTVNLEHYLQGLKRIHRIGQRRRTETIMILADDTVEQKVYASLMQKDARMSGLLNYLKEAA